MCAMAKRVPRGKAGGKAARTAWLEEAPTVPGHWLANTGLVGASFVEVKETSAGPAAPPRAPKRAPSAARALLRGLDLSGAVLSHVDLSGARIEDANVSGLTINGVRVDELIDAAKRKRR